VVERLGFVAVVVIFIFMMEGIPWSCSTTSSSLALIIIITVVNRTAVVMAVDVAVAVHLIVMVALVQYSFKQKRAPSKVEEAGKQKEKKFSANLPLLSNLSFVPQFY
jgi:heme exporter protein D